MQSQYCKIYLANLTKQHHANNNMLLMMSELNDDSRGTFLCPNVTLES